jgi:hypothetical protein
MINKKLIICIVGLAVVIALIVILANPGPAKEELIMVIEVSRHGMRAPSYIFPFTNRTEDNFNVTEELT